LQFNDLKPIQYDYIDRKNSSTGVLAQVVNETYPMCVSNHVGIIPKVMEEATIEGNVITFTNRSKFSAKNSLFVFDL